MSQRQHDLVAEAVAAYKAIRADLTRAVPFWPLGLPGWTDSSLALGMRAPGVTYIAAWRRPPGGCALGGSPLGESGPDGSPQACDPAVIVLPVRHLQGVPAVPEVLYPRDAGAEVSWDAASGVLALALPRTPSACVIRLRTDR
jgi:alpha-galactosidase